MKVGMKGLKTFNGHDGGGFEASLYIDGKRSAIIFDGGFGGEWEWTILEKDRVEALEAKMADQPPWEYEMSGNVHSSPMTLDHWLDENVLARAEARSARKIMTLGPDNKVYEWNQPYKKVNRESILEMMKKSSQAEGHTLLNGSPAIVELA